MTNVPSTTCVCGCAMKLRTRRGPNWLAASVSTTMVIENTRAVIVIIDDSSVASTLRASSG